MIQPSSVEARIAALISAYADQASTMVDAMAMTRLAATAFPSRQAGPWARSPVPRGLAFGLLIAALLVALTAATFVAGGGLDRRDIVDVLTGREFVEPFVGLPPEGAAPSTPEQGQLLLSYYGRVWNIGADVHGMWVYADGRLIWRRNGEGFDATHAIRAFEGIEPTTAVIEQRLTPEGVERLRSTALGAVDPPVAGYPPVSGQVWGEVWVHDGQRLVRVDLPGAMRRGPRGLPGLMADPGAWLPAEAWQDRRLQGYVATHYAICGWPGFAGLLPGGVGALLGTDDRKPWSDCHQVTTDGARVVAASLEDAGFPRQGAMCCPELGPHVLGYSFVDARVPETEKTIVFYPMLPHGEAVEYGS
jgi:hypothetical protein